MFFFFFFTWLTGYLLFVFFFLFAIEYNNPKNAFMKVTINLLGCRANSLSDEGGKLISKTGEAASKCLELNCTSELKQYFFCIPPGASLIEEHVETSQALTKADSLTEIATWIHGINRATIPRHTFQRYEVNLKANVAPLISDNPIKNLDKTIYSPTGYREPFYASFLTRLGKAMLVPHWSMVNQVNNPRLHSCVFLFSLFTVHHSPQLKSMQPHISPNCWGRFDAPNCPMRFQHGQIKYWVASCHLTVPVVQWLKM